MHSLQFPGRRLKQREEDGILVTCCIPSGVYRSTHGGAPGWRGHERLPTTWWMPRNVAGNVVPQLDRGPTRFVDYVKCREGNT